MSRIVTFYSYKGGVGRTFALANIAVLLAKRGKKVLLMDWDLEAPGLHRYFRSYLPDASPPKGLMQLLREAMENSDARWEPFMAEVQIPESLPINIISSGDQAEDYVELVREFSWTDFFENRRGGEVLERWRAEWKKSFDFVFIDSRTGITDVGGVCTVFLPDILVLVFSTNEQSFERGVQIAHGVQESRRKLAVPRPPAAILPLLGRFDGRDEVDDAKQWLDRFNTDLKPFYDDWLPKRFEPRRILELTKIPYIAKFSFGEPLPVLTHGISDPELPGFYLENVTRLLSSDFQEVSQILEPAYMLSSDFQNPADTYQKAVEIIRAADQMGWRQLLKGLRPTTPAIFAKWRQRHSADSLSGPLDRQKAVDEVVDQLAPLLAITLAAVESGDEKFKEQSAFLDDLLNVSGWNYSGPSVLTELPDTMVYIYQSLHGATCLSTQQIDLAVQLVKKRVKKIYDTDYDELWRRPEFMGWPETLGDKCSESWNYLSSLADRCAWLSAVFGSVQEFRISLSAYYMALNVYELAWRFSNVSEVNWSDQRSIDLVVPISFVSEAREIKDRAFSLLIRDRASVEKLWTNFGISRQDIEEVWPNWLRICASWARNVYRLRISTEMPHEKLFELL